MKLSRRLGAVAAMVPAGSAVYDVGTDHAYIPIALIEEGRIPCAVASDIGAGPIRRAEEHIAEHGLSDRIRTVRCDGVPDEPVEGTLVLAGMGGILMSRILEAARGRLEDVRVIVGEPQSDLDRYRRTLCGLGYRIDDEAFLKEDGKYYSVIRAVRSGAADQPAVNEAADQPAVSETADLTEAELLYGPVLIKKKDPLFIQYLREQRAVKDAIIRQLDRSGQPAGHPRRLTLIDEITLIDGVLASMSDEEA